MSKFQALLVSEDSPGHFRPEVVARYQGARQWVTGEAGGARAACACGAPIGR